MVKWLLVLALALSCRTHAAVAEPATYRSYGEWTASDIGGGGYVLGVRFTTDPDRLYAWTDVGGAHRSDDGGLTWRNMTYRLPYGDPEGPAGRGLLYVRDLLADTTDADHVILMLGNQFHAPLGLYRSTDGGETWSHVHRVAAAGDGDARGYGGVLVRSPHDPDVLYAAGLGDGLHQSNDNGESWARLGGPAVQPSGLLVDVDSPDTLYLASLTTDTSANAEVANLPGERLKLDGGLRRSIDGGASWQVLLDTDVRDVAQHRLRDGVMPNLYIVGPDGRSVRVSGDAGQTWSPIETGLHLLKEGGDHWNSHGTYGNLTEAHGSLFLLSTRGDIYKLAEDGASWTRIGPEVVHDPEDWFGATAEHPTYGTDWVNTLSAAADIAIDPNDPARMAVTDWYSVYLSHDRGRTLVNRTEGLENTYIDALVQSPDPSMQDVVHLGMADMGYFRSTDAGASFTGVSNRSVITNNIKSLSVPAWDPDRVYAVGPTPPGGGWWAGVVFISDDAGQTWRQSEMIGLPEMSEPGARAHTILAPDAEPGVVYLAVAGEVDGSGGGVYRSTDAGDTWRLDSAGLPVQSGQSFFRRESFQVGHELTAGPGGTLYALDQDRGRLFRRAAGADAWAPVATPAPFADVAADPHRAGRLFAAAPASFPSVLEPGDGTAGLYRSDDRGETWQRLRTPEAAPDPRHIAIDRLAADRLAVGTDAGVILSRDGGATWTHLDRSLPGRVGWNRGAFAGSRLIVGSGGLGCYWIDLERERPPAAGDGVALPDRTP